MMKILRTPAALLRRVVSGCCLGIGIVGYLLTAPGVVLIFLAYTIEGLVNGDDFWGHEL